MEEEKNAGAPPGMAEASNSKESDSKKKKKKPGGKSSKRRSRKKSEPRQGPADNAEVEIATDTGHLVSSPDSRKRKSGPDGSEVEEEEIGEASAGNTTGRSVEEDLASGKSDVKPSGRDHGREAKRIENENDGERMEPLPLPSRQLRPRKQQEIMQRVVLTDADASRIIGRKIEVFWPKDDKWYPGHVESFDEKKKLHHVLYDDGDRERLNLNKEKFRLQVSHGETFGKPGQSAGDVVDAPLAGNSKNDRGKEKEDGREEKRKKIDGKREEKEQEGRRGCEEDKEDDRNKNNLGKNESQDQVVAGVPDANMQKNLKQIAPRAKRSGSIKQIQQKHASEGQTENAEKRQEIIEQTDGRRDAKQDEESKMTLEMRVSVAVSVTGDSMDEKEGGKQPKQDQSDDFTGKKNDASGLGGSEQMMHLTSVKQINVKRSGAVDTKGLKLSEQGDEIQGEKLSKEVEGLDDMETGGIVTDLPDESETFGREVTKQCNDDEVGIRSKTTDQQDENDSDAKRHDDKGPGEQDIVKDSDPVSKKQSNKKHRGKAKGRETGKR